MNFSVYSNRRTDEYGGTIENRMRFPLEIVRRVRKFTGNDFLLSYRFNASDSAPVETPLSDVIQLCQRFEKTGVDLLHLSAGSSETPAMLLKTLPLVPHREVAIRIFPQQSRGKLECRSSLWEG